MWLCTRRPLISLLLKTHQELPITRMAKPHFYNLAFESVLCLPGTSLCPDPLPLPGSLGHWIFTGPVHSRICTFALAVFPAWAALSLSHCLAPSQGSPPPSELHPSVTESSLFHDLFLYGSLRRHFAQSCIFALLSGEFFTSQQRWNQRGYTIVSTVLRRAPRTHRHLLGQSLLMVSARIGFIFLPGMRVEMERRASVSFPLTAGL